MSNEPSTRGALVIFPGALGDFVCLVPALRELRARRGRLTVVCKGDLAPLARLAGVDQAESIESPIGLWPFLENPPAEASTFFSGYAEIHSFTGAGSLEVERGLARLGGGSARVHSIRPAEPIHVAEHLLRCVGANRSLVDLAEPDAAIARALDALPGPLPMTRSTLVVQPGSGGRAKRWARAGFADVARRWRDGGVVVLLGPAERDEERYWSNVADTVVRDAGILVASQMLARAGAYLGNDSGVSHLAGLVGARGVALFGPTDPRAWRPLSKRIVALRLERWSGVNATPAAEVVEAVRRALAAAATSP